MSHKTKEQKLRAQNRRQKMLSNNNDRVQTMMPERPLYKQDSNLEQIALFTLSDLKKTAVIALFLFGLEFLFFYANLKGVSLAGIQ